MKLYAHVSPEVHSHDHFLATIGTEVLVVLSAVTLYLVYRYYVCRRG